MYFFPHVNRRRQISAPPADFLPYSVVPILERGSMSLMAEKLAYLKKLRGLTTEQAARLTAEEVLTLGIGFGWFSSLV